MMFAEVHATRHILAGRTGPDTFGQMGELSPHENPHFSRKERARNGAPEKFHGVISHVLDGLCGLAECE